MIRPAWASNPDSPITAARQRVPRRYQQRVCRAYVTFVYSVETVKDMSIVAMELE